MVRVSVLNDALVSLASFDKCARRIVERESWRNVACFRIGTLLGIDAERDMETENALERLLTLRTTSSTLSDEERGRS